MPDVDEVVRRLEAGERVNTIAADLGITPRTIRNRLHAAGVPLASARNRQRRLGQLDDPVWLRREYVDEQRTASAIADGLGVTTAEVRTALNRFRIRRPPAHPELTAEALREAFAAGATVSSIAREVGVERATVRAAMTRHGVVNPGADRGRRPGVLDDAEWLRVRYVARAMTVQAIAGELGVFPATVRGAIRRHSIPLRPLVPPWADIDPMWLRQRFEVDLALVPTIAAEAGVSVATIHRTARRLGLTRSLGRNAGRPGGIDPVWLAKRYIDDGLSMAQIAREAGVGTSTVRRAMVVHGIARRPRPSAMTSPSR